MLAMENSKDQLTCTGLESGIVLALVSGNQLHKAKVAPKPKHLIACETLGKVTSASSAYYLTQVTQHVATGSVKSLSNQSAL